MTDVSDDSHNTGAEGDCSPEQVLQDCTVPSSKMKLFHCSAKQETFSNVQQYIETCQFHDSLLERLCKDNMQELVCQTITKLAQLAHLTGLLDIKQEIIDAAVQAKYVCEAAEMAELLQWQEKWKRTINTRTWH